MCQDWLDKCQKIKKTDFNFPYIDFMRLKVQSTYIIVHYKNEQLS